MSILLKFYEGTSSHLQMSININMQPTFIFEFNTLSTRTFVVRVCLILHIYMYDVILVNYKSYMNTKNILFLADSHIPNRVDLN